MDVRNMRNIRKILCVLLALAGCSDDPETKDTSTADTSVATEVAPDAFSAESNYTVVVVVDGETIDLGTRQMTSDKFSFGSAHIAPAVALTMNDSVTFPRTMQVTLDFGVVVPSPEHPIATEGVGAYDFEEGADPSIEVFVKGLQYRAGNAGSSGSIVITDWGTDVSDIVAGTFEGTLVADGPTGKTITVNGTFHLILPEREDGQPH